jgi:hypothetical protein
MGYGPFAITERAPGTLNGVFSATKVQFLHADEGCPQHLLEPPQEVDGLLVAQLSDLVAMKRKVVGDRGAAAHTSQNTTAGHIVKFQHITRRSR